MILWGLGVGDSTCDPPHPNQCLISTLSMHCPQQPLLQAILWTFLQRWLCAPVQLFYRTTTGQWVHVFNVKWPLRKHSNPLLTLHAFNEKKHLLKSILIICTLVQYFSDTLLLARRNNQKVRQELLPCNKQLQ